MNEAKEELLVRRNSFLQFNDQKKTNKELFDAIRSGDKEAFSAYYIEFADPLVIFLTRIIGDEEEAKEIAQDVFVMLWENRERIEPDKKLTGYIYTAGRSMAYNVIRRRKSHSRYESERQFTYDNLGIAPDEKMISDETRILITRVLAQMPEQRRRVFELSRFEGMTYEEIADEMNISSGTVKKHMQLALKDVRTAISVFILFLLINQ